MKSLKSRFILLMLTCLLLSCGVIGAAGILSAKKVIRQDSVQIMNLLCKERAYSINALLLGIEQSVKTLSAFAISQIDDVEKFQTDQAYRKEYSQRIEGAAINAANNTEGALAVYVRYNPRFTGPTAGLFYGKPAVGQPLERLPATDLHLRGPEDTGYAEWYYIPIQSKQATWIPPYLNKNINTQMISYVIPIEMEGVLIGVVGMDIDFNILRDIVEQTTVYNTGYGFLVDDQPSIIYHKMYKMGTPLAEVEGGQLQGILSSSHTAPTEDNLFSYTSNGIQEELVYQDLINGMKFVLTAPYKEINIATKGLVIQIVVASIFIGLIFISVTILITRRIVQPLRELTVAAQKVATGDLNVTVRHQSKDELGILTESFRQTVSHLQKYIDCINELAYRDALTGVKNKTAYLESISRLEQQIRFHQPVFAVVVFDVNGLKAVNDTYGHDFGDMLIVEACKRISRVFRKSPLYRIGGDEFVCILESTDFECYPELQEKFSLECEDYNKNPTNGIPISIAMGIAVFDHQTDTSYNDVFKRADDAMYRNKAKMRSQLETLLESET